MYKLGSDLGLLSGYQVSLQAGKKRVKEEKMSARKKEPGMARPEMMFV